MPWEPPVGGKQPQPTQTQPQEARVVQSALPRETLPFAGIIREMATKYNERPEVLAHQIMVESGADPKRVGKAKPEPERGLMQVMPRTWASLAAQNPELGSFDNAFDPRKNIEAGAQYLRQLLDAHNQDYHDALSFYNAAKNREAGDAYADKVLAGLARATLKGQ